MVAGPAGATYLVFRTLGARMSSAPHIRLHGGSVHDLRETALSSFERLYDTEIEAYLWMTWAGASSANQDTIVRDPGGYLMADLRVLCKGQAKDWTNVQAGCLHNMVCGGLLGRSCGCSMLGWWTTGIVGHATASILALTATGHGRARFIERSGSRALMRNSCMKRVPHSWIAGIGSTNSGVVGCSQHAPCQYYRP